MKQRFYAETHVGRVRSNNEDAHVATRAIPSTVRGQDVGLYAVADGMGGQPAGEFASRVAIEAVRDAAARGLTPKQTTDLADRAVLAAGTGDRAGMGSTLTLATIDGDALCVAHVGDSSAFLMRDGAVRRLTTPHVKFEGLPILDNCLGVMLGAYKGPQLVTMTLHEGDILVLCTDGLTDHADAVTIGRLSAGTAPVEPRAIVERLIQHALAAGGRDNVTVIAVKMGR